MAENQHYSTQPSSTTQMPKRCSYLETEIFLDRVWKLLHHEGRWGKLPAVSRSPGVAVLGTGLESREFPQAEHPLLFNRTQMLCHPGTAFNVCNLSAAKEVQCVLLSACSLLLLSSPGFIPNAHTSLKPNGLSFNLHRHNHMVSIQHWGEHPGFPPVSNSFSNPPRGHDPNDYIFSAAFSWLPWVLRHQNWRGHFK